MILNEKILEFDITRNTLGECVELIMEWIKNGEEPKYFVCANPHSLHLAKKDIVFKESILNADLVTPDGVGIIMASKINGGNIKKRITGSDIFHELNIKLNTCTENNIKVFFLGSTKEVLNKIESKILEDHPNIIIAGTYSPPFKSTFSDKENDEMINVINKAKPDILWVGMTAPKQEKWIYNNINKLDIKFAGAIGAVFDFYIGNIKRSHPIYQKCGLEWLPRLIQEPKRLWRRNFISNPMFIYSILLNRFKIK